MNDINGSLTQVLAEISLAGEEICYYTRGHELISQERNGEVSTYLTDGHFSVRNLADEDGKVTDSYDYDAWGNMISSVGTTKNSFLYCGEQQDSTTGNYYLRARYMSPNTGTFITQDVYQGSIFEPLTLHKYLYAHANPVMNVDPSGYFALAAMAGGTAQSANMQAVNSSVYVNIYNSLVSTLGKSTCILVTKSALEIALISSAIHLGGKLQIALLFNKMIGTLNSVLVGKEDSLINRVLEFSTGIKELLIIGSLDIVSNHNWSIRHVHHIVARKMWYASHSREILRKVNISVEDNINLIEIGIKTHLTIHSASFQLLYSSMVNILLLCSYSETKSIIHNERNVKNAMYYIKAQIYLADKVISPK